MVPNPICEQVGCGQWTAPMIDNPLYKGKWRVPMIDNPEYKGPWSPRKIPNPHYYEDLNPSNMAPIAGVAIEVWTTNAGFSFDNIIIADKLSAAFAFADETFSKKLEYDKIKEKEQEAIQRNIFRESKLAQGGILNTLEVYLIDFILLLLDNRPITFSVLGVFIFSFIYRKYLSSNEKNEADQKSEVKAEEKTEEKVEEKAEEKVEEKVEEKSEEKVEEKVIRKRNKKQ